MYHSNPEKIQQAIHKEVGKTTSYIAKKDLRIHLPKIYENKGILTIGKTVKSIGVYGIYDTEENYATSLSPSLIEFTPTDVTYRNVQDIDYCELFFEAGSVIIPDKRSIIQSSYVYLMYNIYNTSGVNAWFMDMEKLVRLLLIEVKRVTGETFSNYSSIVELITSPIYRDPTDIKRTYREYINQDGMTLDKAKPPIVIPLRNFAYTSNNTLSKFMNSYFEQGLTMALITDSNVITPFDEALRV